MKKPALAKSIKAQKTMAGKVTQKMLDHELHRFTTLTTEELKVRATKIKTPQKAEAMRIMAKWCEVPVLVRAARKRRNELVN